MSCKAKWELRLCGDCDERYPTLLSNVDLAEINGVSGWVDKHLGMDVLTIPTGSATFMCPFCFQYG